MFSGTEKITVYRTYLRTIQSPAPLVNEGQGDIDLARLFGVSQGTIAAWIEALQHVCEVETREALKDVAYTVIPVYARK